MQKVGNNVYRCSWSVLVNEQRTAAVLWSHTKRHSRFFHKTWPTINRPVSVDSGAVPLDCSWSRRFLIHPRVAYALFCFNLLIFCSISFFYFSRIFSYQPLVFSSYVRLRLFLIFSLLFLSVFCFLSSFIQSHTKRAMLFQNYNFIVDTTN